MSEHSDSGSDDVRPGSDNGQGQDDVCRDFLRNVCRRGKRCKYLHPNSGDSETNMGPSSKSELTFCHDYQNTGCHRPTCRFLHCTREEEEQFHQTGQLPSRLQQSSQGSGGNGLNNNLDIPVCRDYMKGECKRGAKCKYRHLSNDVHDCDSAQRNDSSTLGRGVDGHRYDMRSDGRSHPGDVRTNHNHGPGFNNFEDNFERFDRYEYNHTGSSHGHSTEGSSLKRRRGDLDGYSGGGYDSRYGPGSLPSTRPNSYQYQVLEEENAALRKRVEELKKQVADLTATNEVLLEQNARLRVAKSTAVGAMQMPVSQSLAPAVTLSLTSIAQPPTMQATALGTHLNTNLTQQIALNSDMATQLSLQNAQRMAQVAAVAAPPRPQAPQPTALAAAPTLAAPTLNPTVTMNPPLASLSLPQNNLVAVSLPSLVTPAPMQPVPGGSMAQNLCPPSNPLVSYPIMSQDMRCAVAPSSLAH